MQFHALTFIMVPLDMETLDVPTKRSYFNWMISKAIYNFDPNSTKLCHKNHCHLLWQKRKASVVKQTRPWHNQSHYRKVLRWGVSNGARHNWKCFLAYKKFNVVFKVSYIFDTSKCAAWHRNIFEVYDGFIGQKILKLWRQKSWPFGPNTAQISIPVP